jgi:hypothetical protein
MVGGIFYDLDKAFDCTNHKILLSLLEYYGITGKAKLWFESCFNKSCQRVIITKADPNYNTLSDRAEIKHDVQQGSVVGTLLFVLCVNGPPTMINNKSLTILFADDTSIISLQSKSHWFPEC